MSTGAPKAFAFFLIAGLLAGPAVAQTPPQPSAKGSTEVSPVTVTPRTEPPNVTTTFPAAGQAVAPGVLVLTVAFDQVMLKSGFDYAAAPGGEMPECLKTPLLLANGKTFVLLCRTLPGKAYALTLNVKPGGGFSNVAENRAKPSNLAFTTTSDEPVRNMNDALKAAGLTSADLPVEESPGMPSGPVKPATAEPAAAK